MSRYNSRLGPILLRYSITLTILKHHRCLQSYDLRRYTNAYIIIIQHILIGKSIIMQNTNIKLTIIIITKIHKKQQSLNS